MIKATFPPCLLQKEGFISFFQPLLLKRQPEARMSCGSLQGVCFQFRVSEKEPWEGLKQRSSLGRHVLEGCHREKGLLRDQAGSRR
jgi:hypothetical protein